MMREFTRYLVDVNTGRSYDNSSEILSGSLVRHLHDPDSLGTVTSMHESYDDEWCNEANIFWSVLPDPLKAARNAIDENVGCLSSQIDDHLGFID